MDALDNLCSAADSGGHLKGIDAEEIVFLKGPMPNPAPSPHYADTQTFVYMINTMSHLVKYPNGERLLLFIARTPVATRESVQGLVSRTCPASTQSSLA